MELEPGEWAEVHAGTAAALSPAISNSRGDNPAESASFQTYTLTP
jgi:hypothetical protein